MTQHEIQAILSYGRFLAAQGASVFTTDGAATCIIHRAPINAGQNACVECRRDTMSKHAAIGRHCDLMRQGIWKGRGRR